MCVILCVLLDIWVFIWACMNGLNVIKEDGWENERK